MSAATGGAADRTTAAGFGIVGWSPETVLAASFVPSGAVESFGASVASELKTPMGWAGAGPLELSGESLELAYSRNLVAGETYRLGVASRLAYLATETSPLVHFDDALLATTELNLFASAWARHDAQRPPGHGTAGDVEQGVHSSRHQHR